MLKETNIEQMLNVARNRTYSKRMEWSAHRFHTMWTLPLTTNIDRSNLGRSRPKSIISIDTGLFRSKGTFLHFSWSKQNIQCILYWGPFDNPPASNFSKTFRIHVPVVYDTFRAENFPKSTFWKSFESWYLLNSWGHVFWPCHNDTYTWETWFKQKASDELFQPLLSEMFRYVGL